MDSLIKILINYYKNNFCTILKYIYYYIHIKFDEKDENMIK